jgi:PREDICTED: similar to CG14305-PA, isoform A
LMPQANETNDRMSKKKEKAQLDPRTEAVFKHKGYKVTDKISEGAFGKVYNAIRVKENEKCAVKVMDLEKCSEKFRMKFLPRELTVLMQARHANIIQIYDIFRANNRIYIFMELAPNGTIADYLKAHGPLTEKKAREWFTQIVEALHFLHQDLGIAHRDIKVENVLFGKDFQCKLTDFGFARTCFEGEAGYLKLSETYCGTEPYYAPEIIQREPYNPFLTDVWAAGVVLFAILNNKFPFRFNDLKVMLKDQYSRAYKWRQGVEENTSKECKDLMSKMLEPDSKKRINLPQVLEHSWIKQKIKPELGEIELLSKKKKM